ncbi:MAG: ABC transporter ATP-binding protein [Treponema sp.]|nr:ABC transporter ATP-binding protein [Treponema sp.]
MDKLDTKKVSARLSVEGLSASYGKRTVLHDVSFELQSGEFICLSGPNGSGKSTFLSLLAGLVPDALQIQSCTHYPAFNGVALHTLPRRSIAQHIAYMIQDEPCMWNYTVKDIILSGRFAKAPYYYSDYDRQVVDRVIEALSLGSLSDRKVFTLSGGEWQKVRIARALAQEPDMLLLDEPVANLDFGYQFDLLSFIRNYAHTKGVGVLLSIHDVNTAARFADKIALLPPLGACVCGSVQEVLTLERVRAMYGLRCSIFTHPVYHCPQICIE